MESTIILRVNGIDHEIGIKPNETLLDVLRDRFKLKSVKAACWKGECGLCTVLIDGKPMKSCLILATEVVGKDITTVEGLVEDGRLTPVQKCFIEHGAVQCGFCTPAFVLVAEALLRSNPSPTECEVLEAIGGVLCRCTGYRHIIDAILDAVEHRGRE